MTSISFPSLRKVMIWLFIIMVSAFAVGTVFFVLDAPGKDLSDGSWIPVSTPPEEITAARIHLEIDSGSVVLTEGHGSSLLSGRVHGTRRDAAPRLSYLNMDGTAMVGIERQDDLVQFLFGDEEAWELALNNQVPSEIAIMSGTGDITIACGRAPITGLELESGVGSVSLDLTEWSGDHFAATISSGVGDITILLPEDAHIAVALSSGLGDVSVHGLSGDTNGYYHHPVLADAPSLDLAISQGIGDLTIRTVS